jgi:hypothetical protein
MKNNKQGAIMKFQSTMAIKRRFWVDREKKNKQKTKSQNGSQVLNNRTGAKKFSNAFKILKENDF